MDGERVPYLHITGLKKSFGLKPVLRGIDLALERGERLALMGPNGAGKTTTLRILAALTKPSAGTAIIDGLDVERDAQAVRRMVGFAGHQPYLYDELTALENLLFFGKMYGVRDARARSQDLLRRAGLEKRANERAGTFSRGMVQRLSLARALLHSPCLLLLDEPDTGLDQEGVQLVTTILDEHTASGGTTLLTTHQPDRALALCDRVVMLNNGRIVHEGAGNETVIVGADLSRPGGGAGITHNGDCPPGAINRPLLHRLGKNI